MVVAYIVSDVVVVVVLLIVGMVFFVSLTLSVLTLSMTWEGLGGMESEINCGESKLVFHTGITFIILTFNMLSIQQMN